jgi:hypothetical protein
VGKGEANGRLLLHSSLVPGIAGSPARRLGFVQLTSKGEANRVGVGAFRMSANHDAIIAIVMLLLLFAFFVSFYGLVLFSENIIRPR